MSATDGTEVNEIAVELSNLIGVCNAAANSDLPQDQERSLYAVAFILEVLNERLSAIGARLERDAPT